MNSIFGIKGIHVKAIETASENATEVNEFLAAHDGNIIDIQVHAMLYGVTKYIIVYREA